MRTVPIEIVQTEAERVEAWRLHVLVQAGYPLSLAERLARSGVVDLHQAVELLEAGCPVELVGEILL